jgi:hypothetical protein
MNVSFEVIIVQPQFTRAVIRQASPIMEGDLNEIHANLDVGFDEPKTGHVYPRPGGGTYRASAPGESPARRTGNLRDSISEPDVRESSGALVGQITISAEYAAILEFHNNRPFVRPAIDDVLKRFDGGGFLASAEE